MQDTAIEDPTSVVTRSPSSVPITVRPMFVKSRHSTARDFFRCDFEPRVPPTQSRLEASEAVSIDKTIREAWESTGWKPWEEALPDILDILGKKHPNHTFAFENGMSIRYIDYDDILYMSKTQEEKPWPREDILPGETERATRGRPGDALG